LICSPAPWTLLPAATLRPALSGTLAALLVVVAARAAVSYGGEVAALASGRDREIAAAPGAHRPLPVAGPGVVGDQRAGEITTLSARSSSICAVTTSLAGWLTRGDVSEPDGAECGDREVERIGAGQGVGAEAGRVRSGHREVGRCEQEQEQGHRGGQGLDGAGPDTWPG
jgi:hypothetical protein